MKKFIIFFLFICIFLPSLKTEAATTKIIEPNHVFKITISHDIDRATAEEAVSLQCDCDVDYAISYVYDENSKQQVIHIVPSKPLTIGQTYEVVISKELTSKTGKALKNEVRQTFTVKAAEKQTAPVRKDAENFLKSYKQTETAHLTIYSNAAVSQQMINMLTNDFEQVIYPKMAEIFLELPTANKKATVFIGNEEQLQALEKTTGVSIHAPSFDPNLNLLLLDESMLDERNLLDVQDYTLWISQNVYHTPSNRSMYPHGLAYYAHIEHFLQNEHQKQRLKTINLNELKNRTAHLNYNFDQTPYTFEMLNHYVTELNKPLGEISKMIPYAGLEHAWAQTLKTETDLLGAFMIRKLFENSEAVLAELEGKYGQIIGTTNPDYLPVSEKTFDTQLKLFNYPKTYLSGDLSSYRMFLIMCINFDIITYYLHDFNLVGIDETQLKSRPVISVLDEFANKYLNINAPKGISYSEQHGVIFHIIDDYTQPTSSIDKEISELVKKHYQ